MSIVCEINSGNLTSCFTLYFLLQKHKRCHFCCLVLAHLYFHCLLSRIVPSVIQQSGEQNPSAKADASFMIASKLAVTEFLEFALYIIFQISDQSMVAIERLQLIFETFPFSASG